MRNALITGITGQDGSYLAELLLERGYRVAGIVRDLESDTRLLFPSLVNRVDLYQWDMLDQQGIVDVLQQYKTDEIYNFAAYSSGAGMYNDPVAVSEVNGLGVTRILEAIRVVDRKIKLCQASTSEIFGDADESPQTEETKFNPRSPYGAAKLYAHSMIKVYRQQYGIFACSAVLYNHESPRRGSGFVTGKIVNEAVRIKKGLSSGLSLGNLDAYRDWGFAGDYVEAMRLMLQHSFADDYIVATGELHSVREFCELAFKYLEMDYRDYVQVDPEFYRPAETVQLLGNPGKAKNILGWNQSVQFVDLVKMMVDEEMNKYNK